MPNLTIAEIRFAAALRTLAAAAALRASKGAK